MSESLPNYGTDAKVPAVLTPNVSGGALDRCHLPAGKKNGQRVTFTVDETDSHYAWCTSAGAWIVQE